MTRVARTSLAGRPSVALPSVALPLVVLLAVLGAGGAAVAAPTERADAGPPRTGFEMPFPCGQAWTGTTRSSHSPSRNSIDWNRPDDVNDPVVAAAPGTVVRAEPRGTSGYGRWVMLEHLDGERTTYAHLNQVAVALGQTVDQGAQVGTVGETGRAYGSHLHFEERNRAGVVAPYFSGVRFSFGSSLVSQNCVDVPLAGDFVGGPEAELAVFRRQRPATFLVAQPGGQPLAMPFGGTTDTPVVGDWDGDGHANPGVRRGHRRLFRLRTATGVTRIRIGARRDLPVAGDWDGNGRWEVGVRRAGSGIFLMRHADGTRSTAVLGDADDLPVTGDWNGDGRTDLGAFDRTTAVFTLRIVDAEGLAWTARVPFGQPGDLPVTGDWDGNGRTDVGTWDPATATFTERRARSAMTGRHRTRQTLFGNPR